ncbi:DsbA family oxidoreductase [Chelativorans sp. YIM 93263]|uniref:DsbA family oxidoreductase n=1 Tax=Chelativorans sp. YIM 93263 TaxID=2906648 RepID=UPI00403DB60C
MSSKAPISVDVVSDVVCPWCYVGQRNLQRAQMTLDDVAKFTVRWRPYQLDPFLPPSGRGRKSYMLDKFGNAERIEEIHNRLREIGSEAGISFDFDAISVSPNTLDAHRVIRWAATAGEEVQNNLVSQLFRLYFEKGANIGEHEVLTGAAQEAGMDVAAVEALLPTPADRSEVEAEIATAQRMGVTGVPCFMLEGRYALMGVQPPQTLADAITEVSETKARGELDDDNT